MGYTFFATHRLATGKREELKIKVFRVYTVLKDSHPVRLVSHSVSQSVQELVSWDEIKCIH